MNGGSCVQVQPGTGSRWVKPSLSFISGNCVEVQPGGTQWAKPSLSFANGNCVEAAGPFKGASFNEANCVQAAGDFASASGNSGNCVEAAGAFKNASNAAVNCVEAHVAGDPAKAAASDEVNGCVEVIFSSGDYIVRDSKTPDAGHIHFPRGEWDGGRVVKFTPVSRDVALSKNAAAVTALEAKRENGAIGGWYTVEVEWDELVLVFDGAEKDAWDEGVVNSEFEAVAEPVAV